MFRHAIVVDPVGGAACRDDGRENKEITVKVNDFLPELSPVAILISILRLASLRTARH